MNGLSNNSHCHRVDNRISQPIRLTSPVESARFDNVLYRGRSDLQNPGETWVKGEQGSKGRERERPRGVGREEDKAELQSEERNGKVEEEDLCARERRRARLRVVLECRWERDGGKLRGAAYASHRPRRVTQTTGHGSEEVRAVSSQLPFYAAAVESAA